MKKIIIFTAIAVVVLYSCQNQNEKRNNKSMPIRTIENMKIDSSQYGIGEVILYFSNGDTILKFGPLYALGASEKELDAYLNSRTYEFETYEEYLGDVIIINQDTIHLTTRQGGTIKTWLLENLPEPQSFSSVSFNNFKKEINSQFLDSVSINEEDTVKRCIFYLSKFKTFINIYPNRIYFGVQNSRREFISQFSDQTNDWSYEQKEELLKILLAKK